MELASIHSVVRTCLGFAMGAVPATAFASTLLPMTLDEQRESAALIVEAEVASIEYIVLDDGYPITEYELKITRDIVGASRTDAAERLRLPGGVTTEGEVVVEGSPQLVIGTTVLLVGRRDRGQTLLPVGGRRSLFIADTSDGTAIAVNTNGDPITAVTCPEGVAIARPLAVAPADPESAPADRVYVEDPRSVGLGWADFADEMSSCLGGAR